MRRGDYETLVFTSLDKRNGAAAPRDSLRVCLNEIIGRDGRVYRRPAASLLPVSIRDTNYIYTRHLPFGAVNDPDTVGDPQLETYRPLAVLPFSYRYEGGADTYDVLANTELAVSGTPKNLLALESLDGATQAGSSVRLTTPGWDGTLGESALNSGVTTVPHYRSEDVETVFFDSSIPGSPTNYEMAIVANGKSLMQSLRTDANSIWTTPVVFSGGDPAIHEMLSRADTMTVHRNQAYYTNPETPTILFYSLPPGETGGPQYSTIDPDNNWMKIDSGSDSPIRRPVSYADALYIFTKKNTWRVTGNVFDGATVQKKKVFDVGCPSRNGVDIIKATGGELESRDSTGRLIFVTNDQTVVVSDGVVCQVVGLQVEPTLSELHPLQVEQMIVRVVPGKGLVVFLWPSADGDSTDGLVYDYLAGVWVGELRYDFRILWAERVTIRGREILMAGSDNALNYQFFSAAGTSAEQNEYKGIIFDLWGEDTGVDFFWRGKSDSTADADYTDYAGIGKTFRTEIQSQNLTFGLSNRAAGLRSAFFKFEPCGEHEVTLNLFCDGKLVPDTDIYLPTMLGPEVTSFGTTALEDGYFTDTIAKPRETFINELGHKMVSGQVALGVSCEPEYNRVETIAGKDPTDVLDVLCAYPGGFILRAIELSYTGEKTFPDASHTNS